MGVWSALNCLGVAWQVKAEGDNQGPQNNCEPLHGADRSCSPALTEEEEGPASPPELVWDFVHPLGPTTSAAAREGFAEAFGEGKVGTCTAPTVPPETPFSEYPLRFQARFLRPSRSWQWCIRLRSASCSWMLFT